MSARFTCPKCNQKAGVPIIYGFPSQRLFRQEKRKEVVLGGCIVMPDDRQCIECRHQWTHQPDT